MAGDAPRARRSNLRRCSSRCCANAARSRRYFRSSRRCSVCHSLSSGTRKSTPAYTRSWWSRWPPALSPLATRAFCGVGSRSGQGRHAARKWPRHAGHEVQSVQRVQQLCARFRIPNDYRDLAVLVARHHGVVHRAFELRAATVLDLFAHTDALRRPERFEQFLLACESDARGRKGLEQRAYPQADWLRAALSAARAVSPDAEELQAGGAEIAAGFASPARRSDRRAQAAMSLV